MGTHHTSAPMLIGRNPRFLKQIETARRAARSNCSVLILGETGTGKELVAQTIHHYSQRREHPFLAINCGALTNDLLGAELFGHERGAFTGAMSQRDGLFVQANHGSLFLDELAELPIRQQPLLLRVLETQSVRPLGSTLEQAVDVRIIAATNRPDPCVSSHLRLDLFHRIATIVISMIPLRERADDIPAIVQHTINELRETVGPRSISPTTMGALCEYSWPGNVRELIQAVRRAAILNKQELTLDHLLPSNNRSKVPQTSATVPSAIEASIRGIMAEALAKYGSFRSAARALGVPKSTFADRAQRYGLRSQYRERQKLRKQKNPPTPNRKPGI